MASYSPSLRLILPTVGGDYNTWGDSLNETIDLIEDALTGIAKINLAGLSTYTLTASQGVVDEARKPFLIFSGTTSASVPVVIPAEPKQYLVLNSSTNAVTVGIAGSTVTATVGAGAFSFVYCDGTNTYGKSIVTYDSISNYGLLTSIAPSGATALTNLYLDANGIGVGAYGTSSTTKFVMAASTALQTVTATILVPSVTDWTTKQIVPASDADARYVQAAKETNFTGGLQINGVNAASTNDITSGNNSVKAWASTQYLALAGNGQTTSNNTTFTNGVYVNAVGGPNGSDIQFVNNINLQGNIAYLGNIAVNSGVTRTITGDTNAYNNWVFNGQISTNSAYLALNTSRIMNGVTTSGGYCWSSGVVSYGYGQLSGALCVTDVNGLGGNFNAGVNITGTEYGGAVHQWYFHWDDYLYDGNGVKFAKTSDLPFTDTSRKMQSFVVTGNGQSRINFPVAFAGGSVPQVFIQINQEANGTSRAASLTNSSGSTPSVDNSGFTFQPVYLTGAAGTSGQDFTIYVLAIGNF